MSRLTVLPALTLMCLGLAPLLAAEDVPDTSHGDKLVAEYFRAETQRLSERTFAGIKTLEDWQKQQPELRRQLLEMLGLDPLPERTPLNAVVTGTVDHPEFTVDKVHFQSSPQLYVTGNLYLPKRVTGPVPAILYVCGHAQVKIDGVAYGNKTSYQHHAIWFARHGYACLVIDSLQLGEIEALHHGTYREGMWWWHCRGYSPAGVEAWNCMRALDYLESRPEIDKTRLGVTGRSGGGAYSWWLAALDQRIQCAVPVAGITNLDDHVVQGCIEGHCDCMYQVNTYGWDYPLVAALVAPRALLISNTDKDPIFPLEGVVDVYSRCRDIYRLHNATDRLGLQITEGGHIDQQELYIHSFVWMDRFLRNETRPVTSPAEKLFIPQQLKVFDQLPADQRNTRIQEEFVPLGKMALPGCPLPIDAADWAQQRDGWMQALREKSFREWPKTESDDAAVKSFNIAQTNDITQTDDPGELSWSFIQFTAQAPYRLPVIVVSAKAAKAWSSVELHVVNQQECDALATGIWTLPSEQTANKPPLTASQLAFITQRLKHAQSHGHDAIALFAPRGVGPSEWTRDEKERTHIRRRFALLGQTDDGMRIYDVVQAIAALRTQNATQVHLSGAGPAAGWALYASLFANVDSLTLLGLPPSHREGPILLNVLRYLDVPQAVAMAAERTTVQLIEPKDRAENWNYPRETAARLGWGERLRISAAE